MDTLEKRKISYHCWDSNPGSLIIFALSECKDEGELRGRVSPSVCVTPETALTTDIYEVW